MMTNPGSMNDGTHPAMPRVAAAALGALAALACAVPAPAQEDARLDVGLAALEHVRESLPPGRAILDPRILCRATIAGWTCPEGMEERVRAMDLELGSRDFSYVCEKGPGDCRLVGTDVLVQLTEPRIMRNTATITVNVWWSTGDAARPVGSRRSQLHLQRHGGAWRVVRERLGMGAVAGSAREAEDHAGAEFPEDGRDR